MATGGWVYIMANRYRGGMYVGVTSDPIRRVYVEHHAEIGAAIAREKLVKKWRREWKFALIEADNPDWHDLWSQWFDAAAKQE